jgi:hypothetical protein
VRDCSGRHVCRQHDALFGNAQREVSQVIADVAKLVAEGLREGVEVLARES